MTKDEIFKCIQKSVENVPLLLVGSGSSAPHGLPLMGELGEHLLVSLNETYSGDVEWDAFKDNIENGQDLETALSNITLPEAIIGDIKIVTWKFISTRDLKLFNKVISYQEQIPLARLIGKFYQVHPKCVHIITTNYDRVVEYACDSLGVPVNTGFRGDCFKNFGGVFCSTNGINIIKVHGSLDVFKNSKNQIISVPMQYDIPDGLAPELITPGLSKYQAVLKGTSRELLMESDQLIDKAESYLCIGYGFNDEQIQENIIKNISRGKSILIITKTLSERAAELLASNANNYVSIECAEDNTKSKFCINKNVSTLDGTYWTIDGFMKIID